MSDSSRIMSSDKAYCLTMLTQLLWWCMMLVTAVKYAELSSAVYKLQIKHIYCLAKLIMVAQIVTAVNYVGLSSVTVCRTVISTVLVINFICSVLCSDKTMGFQLQCTHLLVYTYLISPFERFIFSLLLLLIDSTELQHCLLSNKWTKFLDL